MESKSIYIFIIFAFPFYTFCLNCEQYRTASIQDISFGQVSWKELKGCLPLIGRAALDKRNAENIWKLIKEFHGVIENVPVPIFQNMGWVLSGIPIDDLHNVTMDEISIIQAFGTYRGLSNEQMSIIADKVRNEWANKTPERYSSYDLKALQQILCLFNESEILAIHADAYKEAAEEIGNLRDCPIEIIRAFARLAVQPNAFGSPDKWSKIDVSAIGVIITGLTPQEYTLVPGDYLSVNRKFSNKTESNDTRSGEMNKLD